MWRDIQTGLVQMRRRKLFALTLVLLVALGIGSNAVIFSFLDALLFERLPVRSPDNLYLLQKNRMPQVRSDTAFFYAQYQATVRNNAVFAAAVAEQGWAGNSFQALSSGDNVRLVATQIVSPNYFGELGIKAVAGRMLTPSDAAITSLIPVVISEQFWASQFHRSPKAINRTIRVREYPFLIVGVWPREFHGINADRVPDIRFPISAALPLTGTSLNEAGGDYPVQFQVLARLRPGISMSRAARAIEPEMTRLDEAIWRDWYTHSPQPISAPELQDEIKWQRSYRVALLPARRGVSQLRDQFSRAVSLLMGAVGLLLLAVCATVAGLLLARAEERRREIALRLSVGATRSRLVRQLFIENSVLALPGAALGVGFVYALAPALVRLLPALGVGPYAPPFVLESKPGGHVLLFVLAASVVTVLLFGIAPARRALTVDLNDQLKAYGRGFAAARSGPAIVAIQVALAALLVCSATLMMRTFWNLEHLDPGFDRAHVLEFTVDPWDAGYSEERAGALLRDLRQQVGALPGVRAVSFAMAELMRGMAPKTTVVPAGSRLPAKTFLNTSFNRVTPDYFQSLGIPLLAGRNFERRDVGPKPIPIIVNQAFARTFFPHTDPVGKEIVQGTDGHKGPTHIIIGVVGTAKYRSMREENPPIFYQATDDRHSGGAMYVRTYGAPNASIQAVRRILHDLAPALPFASAFTLEQELQQSLWQERLVTLLCAFFGLAALLLSATGLYGTLAYSVARRTKEFGIRIALGAQVRDVIAAVSSRIGWAVAIGLLAGLTAAVALLRFARTLLFGVDPFDPASLFIVATVLLLCCVLAAVLPSWRALKTDANAALRQE